MVYLFRGPALDYRVSYILDPGSFLALVRDDLVRLCKTAENEATLKSYLIGCGEERVVLLGGYVLEDAGEGKESPVEISEPIASPEYEQMELPEAFERSETG